MSIIFACPNCGASQNVNDDETSTQCQFCGNTISVPENLRPKTPPAAQTAFPSIPSSQPFTLGSAANMAGLPGMFMNMDLNKLRAMAMAARNGDKAEAARLYQENFGVSPEAAMQAAELMSQHHPLVLGQMQFGTPPVAQMGSQFPMAPASMATPIYTLPSPPVSGGRSGTSTGARWGACIAIAFVLIVAVVIGGAIITSAVLSTR